MSSDQEYEKLLKLMSKNIKAARANKGLTQENMIDHGFNYRHYQRLESGTYSPTLHTLFRLSEVFKVKVAYFFEK